MTAKEFILSWNEKFPYDYLYRVRHNIPFGSPEHQKLSFFNTKLFFVEVVSMYFLHKEQSSALPQMSEEEKEAFSKIDVTKVTETVEQIIKENA